MINQDGQRSSSAMRRFCNLVQAATAALAAATLASFSLLMIVDVACRYWLHVVLPWTAELSILLFQWTAALGAALALRRGLHFGLGLVLPVHGRLGRHLIAAFVGVVVLVSSLFLAVIAAQMVARTWQSSYATLPVPHGVAYVGLLVGAVLMMIFAVEQSVLHAAGPEVAA